jgi:hypothetical protein
MTENELIQSLSAVAADQRVFAEVLDMLSQTALTAESWRDFQSRAEEARCEAEQFDKFAEQVKKRAEHMQTVRR